MSLIATIKTYSGEEKAVVNIDELAARLKSLTEGCDMEIMRLAILSILDEMEDATVN